MSVKLNVFILLIPHLCYSNLMRTKIIKVPRNDLLSAQSDINAAGSVIRNGGLVAFPTETVYGLGGDALNAESSSKIYAAKGRPSDNPLIVHIADIQSLDRIAINIPETAYKLAEAFWPGPLTMVLNKTEAVPFETTGGLNTVAVRMPSDNIALEFIRAAGGYIAAPSANTSGRPSPTSASHVAEDMDGRIEMILDGGPCTIGLESTIVDLTEDTPMILRPGYISEEMIAKITGSVTIDPAIIGEISPDLRPKAPGMKYRHYAPKGNLAIISGDRDDVCAFITQKISEDHKNGKRVGVIACNDTLDNYMLADFVGSAGDRNDEISISSNLYSLLRECDEKSIDSIYSEEFDTPQLGMAIMNRLMKAAGHTIINV